MSRVALTLLLIALVAEVAALVNCALTPESEVRGIPKPVWLLVILLFPGIGALLWFVFGHERERPRVRRSAPDDDPEFLRGLGRPRRAALPARPEDDVLRSLEDDLRDPDPDPADDDEGEAGRRRG